MIIVIVIVSALVVYWAISDVSKERTNMEILLARTKSQLNEAANAKLQMQQQFDSDKKKIIADTLAYQDKILGEVEAKGKQLTLEATQLREGLRIERQYQAALTAAREKSIESEKILVEAEKQKTAIEKTNIARIIDEKTKGFPWLAEAFAEYNYQKNLKVAKYLANKPHPAPVGAQDVKEIAKGRRNIEQKLRVAQKLIKMYHVLFPFLEDLEEADDELLQKILSQNITSSLRDITEIAEDPVRLYTSHIPKDEYSKLTESEKNQRALDRYLTRNKPNWQIGRDYERFVGYLHEKEGHRVLYHGIFEGLEDLGRDLICKKPGSTKLIQCKYWSKKKQKVIREKHIMQLYGTLAMYRYDNPNEQVSGSLYTSVTLSDTARKFATHLGIDINEDFSLDKYPMIKCHISSTKDKIYHLPFDQQYDTCVIEENKGDFYCATVVEAEQAGFRRAWRWHSQQPSP